MSKFSLMLSTRRVGMPDPLASAFFGLPGLRFDCALVPGEFAFGLAGG
ncbi:hypothetical protein [Trinickia diaoshuihuensis]|nr:hypothetical protein [Trinickia diaoshuihuensis]